MAYTNTKDEKLVYYKKLNAYLNSGDESMGDELFADDFKMLVPGTGGRDAPGMPIPPGKEGPKALIRAMHAGFSDFKFEMLKLISEDDGGEDITAGRSDWSGVHTGTFMGVPATGKHVCVRMATFDRVVDGKMVSSEVIMDIAGLLIQLGVMPPPTSL